MPCCTYLQGHEKNLPIQNKHVAEWLALAREYSGIELVIIERKFEFKKWFKARVKWRYEVLIPLCDDHIEYQIVNFYRDGTNWTINHMVPAELAVAYLIGICFKREPTPQNDGLTTK